MPETHHSPLATETFAHERKKFFVDLKENQRGRFLRITEDVAGRRDTILMPIDCLPVFIHSLTRLREFANQLPAA